MPDNRFLFCTCQRGAENALKAEVARVRSDFKFAYSRPGFVTFKLPEDGLPEGGRIFTSVARDWVFARSCGFSLGRLKADGPDEVVDAARAALAEIELKQPFRNIHVWTCDERVPGDQGWEPAISDVSRTLQARLAETLSREGLFAGEPKPVAEKNESVLDCVEVRPGEWWLGRHTANDFASRLPGGIPQISLPEDVVSRAWLKMEEALEWSGFAAEPGGRWVELGCAPGGAVQSLVSREMEVLGIDPAALAPEIVALPRFRHLRKRTKEVRRREFRKIRWLASDMNVAPNYALDAVEDIVAHPEIHIRGMLITLKLSDYALAEQIPQFLERITNWGFNIVRARQLCFNRREICVAALKKPFRR